MKLISNDTDFDGLDCHVHSRFSPDAKAVGADEAQEIANTVRARGLRGFIITDHLDVGYWDGYIIDFEKYFRTWQKIRKDNPDLTIYIGLEVGHEKHREKDTEKIIADLPLEYIINSVHYYRHTDDQIKPHSPFLDYLNGVLESLDAPYEFNAIGHLGFLERYCSHTMLYDENKNQLDAIIKKALERDAIFEINTNAGGEMRLPRERFLTEYKNAGGRRPMLGSDAHVTSHIGQYFKEAVEFSNKIFGNRQ